MFKVRLKLITPILTINSNSPVTVPVTFSYRFRKRKSRTSSIKNIIPTKNCIRFKY